MFRSVSTIPADNSKRSAFFCSDESRTDQSGVLNADLNMMLQRFGQGARLPENYSMPMYGSFEDAPDNLQSALDRVKLANVDFLNLPFPVREAFGHSPHKFVEFSNDTSPDARAFAVKLGLIPPPVASAPVPAPAPAPAPAPSPAAS